jgi:3-deoxy-7-phosphoheptulonate synthase
VLVGTGSGAKNADATLRSLHDIPVVEHLLYPKTSYQLAHRSLWPKGTVVRKGSLTVREGHFSVIAGPCSVEGEEQVQRTAKKVKELGATGLRGGAFKPRSSPYSFQGLKEEGLEILARARQATSLAVVTEAMTPEEVPLVAEYADVLQIGTRNMQNYRLLEAAGRARLPVLLKRGFSATLDEFLMAAEYILSGGNDQIILCERGIRTFENHARFTLSLSSICALRQRTHLPVIVDPSHATGDARMVTPMAAAAVAAGADGLLVEVHPTPPGAKCDGKQSLTFEEFGNMMRLCQQVAAAVGKTFGPMPEAVFGPHWISTFEETSAVPSPR